MRIIDFHSHFFARPFFEALAAQAAGAGPVDATLQRVAAEAGIELPPAETSAHLERWIAALDEHGVEHLCTFASLPEECEAVGEAVSLAGGRLSGFCLVDPRAASSAEVLQERLASGLYVGVLLFPAMHHVPVGGPEMERILGPIDDLGGIVFVHCGLLVVRLRDLLGLPRPYDLSYANPLSIIPAANRFRRIRFVIPHFGAGFFREALMTGTQCENVYVDTSSSNSWITTQPGLQDLADVFRRALAVYGPERILFGTDSNVFPAGWRRDRLEQQLAALEHAGATSDERDAIVGRNAAALLGL